MCSEQGGTVLCALFGPQSSATYDLDYLLQRWLEPPVVTTIGVMILAFVGSIPVDRWLSDDSGQSKRAVTQRHLPRCVLARFLPILRRFPVVFPRSLASWHHGCKMAEKQRLISVVGGPQARWRFMRAGIWAYRGGR